MKEGAVIRGRQVCSDAGDAGADQQQRLISPAGGQRDHAGPCGNHDKIAGCELRRARLRQQRIQQGDHLIKHPIPPFLGLRPFRPFSRLKTPSVKGDIAVFLGWPLLSLCNRLAQ